MRMRLGSRAMGAMAVALVSCSDHGLPTDASADGAAGRDAGAVLDASGDSSLLFDAPAEADGPTPDAPAAHDGSRRTSFALEVHSEAACHRGLPLPPRFRARCRQTALRGSSGTGTRPRILWFSRAT
jgi:hypothetical protein